MTRILSAGLMLWACLVLLAGPGQAAERILDYHADITVDADAGVEVRETIRVQAEGQEIRHGIYRDFPTRYRDGHGMRVRVGFEPLALTRDGAPEPWRSERKSNGVRVYFGSSEALLPAGEHEYVFRFRTTRQLGFFADHDELYWNVTGNGWEFPIDHASARVTLPGAIPPADLALEAYTGPAGAKGTAWTARAEAPSQAGFATTAPLAPREGLTIVVGFPQGVVKAPDRRQKLRWLVDDNAGLGTFLAGLLVVLGWYLVQWWRVGRDPAPGTIIPRYEPPAGTTPSALRYVERMGWDARCAAADLVDAAVRGVIRIAEEDGSYRIERVGEGELPPAEAQLVKGLLHGARRFTLEQGEHKRIATAMKAHKAGLRSAWAGHFNRNTIYVVIGALLSLLFVFVGGVAAGGFANSFGTAFILVWLSVWTVGVAALMASSAKAWREVGRARGGERVALALAAVFISLFAVPFVLGELLGIGMLFMLAGAAAVLALLVFIATNALFLRLMKAPTREGRKLLDQIEGLRLYLGVAERDELRARGSPPLTAEEFHRMLPWALALGVERNWSDRFAAVVGAAGAEAAVAAAGWYAGSSSHGFSHFTSSLGSSFSSAISSSSSAPGSSSGGGGGGSSGGGGGGGGGGGW